MLLNVPSVQGSGAKAPGSQYEPATHPKHAVWPLSFMNVPASQLLQEGCVRPPCWLEIVSCHPGCLTLPTKNHYRACIPNIPLFTGWDAAELGKALLATLALAAFTQTLSLLALRGRMSPK